MSSLFPLFNVFLFI